MSQLRQLCKETPDSLTWSSGSFNGDHVDLTRSKSMRRFCLYGAFRGGTNISPRYRRIQLLEDHLQMASPAIELKHIVHKDLMDDVAKKRLKILPQLGEPERRPELIWPLAKSMNKKLVRPEKELDVTRIIAYEPLVGINPILLHDKMGWRCQVQAYVRVALVSSCQQCSAGRVVELLQYLDGWVATGVRRPRLWFKTSQTMCPKAYGEM
jgi:hypothetical protein